MFVFLITGPETRRKLIVNVPVSDATAEHNITVKSNLIRAQYYIKVQS